MARYNRFCCKEVPSCRRLTFLRYLGSVVVREEVVVGQPLPETVVLTPVPSHQDYSYAVVNNRRVVVEPRTRQVIRIIE